MIHARRRESRRIRGHVGELGAGCKMKRVRVLVARVKSIRSIALINEANEASS